MEIGSTAPKNGEFSVKNGEFSVLRTESWRRLYALAAAKPLPHAIQVADRWHLMENASHAFLDAVRESKRHACAAFGAATINPDLLTAAERNQYEG